MTGPADHLVDVVDAAALAPPPRKLRVLVNAVHARAGGGLTYLRHLLPLLAEAPDLDIALIPHPSQADAFAALSPALRIHRLAMPRSWFGLLLWEQAILPFRAWRIGYDVVLSPANFGPLAIRRQVVVLQNALTVGALERRLGPRLYWAALRLMTALSLVVARGAIAVSRYAAATVGMRWLPQRVPAVIHHGVDSAFMPAPIETAGSPFLLAVGDLYVQKSLRHLIEALVLVRRRHPEVTLRIAGEPIDTDYAAGLRRRVGTLGLGGAVTFLGRCERAALIELYRSCAVFVFPSLEESFGLPLVEAMACGAAVVAANSAATPEIAGGAALLCDPASPPALADAILLVLDDAALRQSLRRQSLERAGAFAWPDCARRTAAVLRDAAG